jgi:hypothetical protein
MVTFPAEEKSSNSTLKIIKFGLLEVRTALVWKLRMVIKLLFTEIFLNFIGKKKFDFNSSGHVFLSLEAFFPNIKDDFLS